ncbi:carboxypeptidase-like regulatory domain-containing protein [Flavobacterium foetidum]|uniref:carboxypeptidase-like regulatory domain-containing protein n=1 Tax=Flavobacterium foetidum TaxID=2026681 RepID=UPI001074FBB7|nr:carboxypeptidase-like regulatory domain-containing protein [Flavobacterium foetidum]KAF2514907.1 carboxypeptidase-like regulatory domain-containing protein [Flavobacterium foetidum]
MKRFLILSAIILKSNLCISQLRGKCIDSTGKPIPYVNIGISDTSVGTVTDLNGDFIINNKTLQENILIIASHIGYETKSYTSVKNAEIEIVMTQIGFQLDEVKIETLKFTDEKKIGNNSLSKHVLVGFSSKNLGAEVGKFFKNQKNKKIKIEKIHFEIAELGYKKGTFRINFYNAENDKNIEKVRLNNDDIIMDVEKTGDVDIDIKSNNLILENDFLVSIECINVVEKENQDPKEKKIIYFSSNVFCGPVYRRSNNLIKWNSKKEKYDMGLGIQLFVKYQTNEN